MDELLGVLGVELEVLEVLGVLGGIEALPVPGAAAALDVVDEVDGELSLEPLLFSLFDPLSADAAGAAVHRDADDGRRASR